MEQQKIKKDLQGVLRMSIKRAAGDLILLYRLSEDNVPASSLRYQKSYSITVTRIDSTGKNRQIKQLPDIARSRQEAERIFDLLSRNMVTPMALEDVINDLFAM